MSYLDLPRLTFFGQFRADPSTSNNDPCHYAPGPVENPWWNKMGSQFFQFRGCTVTSVATATGKLQTAKGDDSIISTPVVSTDDPQVAKLVDLDPEQQMVSQVWGLQLCIGDRSSRNYVLANFRATNFRDMSGRVPGKHGSRYAGAAYTSALDVIEWGSALSPALSALKAVNDKALSIRFVLDRYDNAPMLADFVPNPNFTFGRVTGAIGPLKANEPTTFVVGRFLRVPLSPLAAALRKAAALMKSMGDVQQDAAPAEAAPAPVFNYAHAIVDPASGRLSFDFGNSLCFEADGNPYPMGTLTAGVAGGASIAPIPATLDDYKQRSWIYDVFNAGSAAAAAKAPLALLSNGSQVLIENPNGSYVDVAEWVYRTNPGDPPMDVKVMTMQWGAPMPNQTVQIIDAGEILLSPPPPNPPGVGCTNMPFSTPKALKYPAKVTTGGDGTITFQVVTERDPGHPRDGLDGQVYAISPRWKLDGNPDENIGASILVHTGGSVPDKPDWEKDVLPTFAQYMKLYPFMQDRMDLTNQPTVIASSKLIQQLLQLPFASPGFMPATRDLSSVKLNTILKWLKTHES